MRNIIVDFLIAAMSLALLFYSLQSVTGAQYAGTGFQYGNQNLVVPGVLLIIFTLGIFRLVFDLKELMGKGEH